MDEGGTEHIRVAGIGTTKLNTGCSAMEAAASILGIGSRKRRPFMCCAAAETTSDYELVEWKKHAENGGQKNSSGRRQKERAGGRLQGDGQGKERHSHTGFFAFFGRKRRRRAAATQALKTAMRSKDAEMLETALEDAEVLGVDSACVKEARELLRSLRASSDSATLVVKEVVNVEGVVTDDNLIIRSRKEEDGEDELGQGGKPCKTLDMGEKKESPSPGWEEKVRRNAKAMEEGMNSGGLVSDITGRRSNRQRDEKDESDFESSMLRTCPKEESSSSKHMISCVVDDSTCEANGSCTTVGESRREEDKHLTRKGSSGLRVDTSGDGDLTSCTPPMMTPNSDVDQQWSDCVATFAISPSVKEKKSKVDKRPVHVWKAQRSRLPKTSGRGSPAALATVVSVEGGGDSPGSDRVGHPSASGGSWTRRDETRKEWEKKRSISREKKSESAENDLEELQRRIAAAEDARKSDAGKQLLTRVREERRVSLELSQAVKARDVARLEKVLLAAESVSSSGARVQEAEILLAKLKKEQEQKGGMDTGKWRGNKDGLQTALREAERLGLKEQWVRDVKEVLGGMPRDEEGGPIEEQRPVSESHGEWQGGDGVNSNGDGEDDDEVTSRPSEWSLADPGASRDDDGEGKADRKPRDKKQVLGTKGSSSYLKNKRLLTSTEAAGISGPSFAESGTGSPHVQAVEASSSAAAAGVFRSDASVTGVHRGDSVAMELLRGGRGGRRGRGHRRKLSSDGHWASGETSSPGRRVLWLGVGGPRDRGKRKVQVMEDLRQGKEVEEEWGEVGDGGKIVQGRFSPVVERDDEMESEGREGMEEDDEKLSESGDGRAGMDVDVPQQEGPNLGWALRFLQQAMTEKNLQSLELGVAEAERRGLEDSEVCRCAKTMITRIRREREVRLMLEAALVSGKVDRLEEAVKAAGEAGLEGPAGSEARQRLQVWKEDKELNVRLQAEIMRGHLVPLEEVVASAMSRRMDGPLVREAEGLLGKLRAERGEMLIVVEKGIADRDRKSLAPALFSAERLGLEDHALMREARKRHERLGKEEDASAHVKRAIQSRDLNALRSSLLMCTELGLDGDEIREWRRVLSVFEREKEAADLLAEAAKGGNVENLLAAIERAERAGVASEKLDVAITILEDLKKGRTKEETARAELKTAIASRDLVKLESALALAKKVPLDGARISEAESLMQILRREEEVRVIIREAIQRRSLSELEKAVAAAEAFSLKDGLVEVAGRELRRAREEMEVKMMTMNAMAMEDIRELKLAVGHADRLGLTGGHIDEGRQMLESLIAEAEQAVNTAMEEGGLEKIEAAVKAAQAKGMDGGKSILEAKRRLSKARDEKWVRETVDDILQKEESVVSIQVMEEAVAAAQQLGVEGPAIETVTKTLERVRAKREVSADLKRGLLERDFQVLDSSLVRADSLGVKSAEVSEVRVLVERSREKRALMKKLRATIDSQDLDKLEELLAGARKKVREWIEEDETMELEAGMLGDLLQEAGDIAQRLRERKKVCAWIREITASGKRDVAALEEATQALEKVGGEEEPAYAEAKIMIGRWIREREVLDKVRRSSDAAETWELASAVREADLIGLDGEEVVKRGRSFLESLKKKGDVKVKLRLATALREVKSLETAVAMAEGMDLGESKEVSKAREVLAKLGEEKQVVALVKVAMESGDLESLEKVWERARKLGIEDPCLQEGKRMLEKKWAMRAAEWQLMDAVENRDLRALGVALAAAANQGMDPKVLEEAQTLAQRLGVEKQIKTEIMRGVEEERWEGVAKAVKRAEEINWEDEDVKAAKKLIEEVKLRNEVLVKMKDAAARRNLEDLIMALELARRLGIEEEEVEEVKRVLAELHEEDTAIKEIATAAERRDLGRLEVAIKAMESMKGLEQNAVVREGLVILGQLKKERAVFEDIREAIETRSLRRLEAAVREFEEMQGFENNLTVVEAKKVIGQLRVEKTAMDKVREAFERKDVRRLGEAVREVEWLVDRREWDPVVEKGRRAYQDVVKIWSEVESAMRNRDVDRLRKSLERWDRGPYGDWQDRRVEEGREVLGKLEITEMMLERGLWSRDLEALRKGLEMAAEMRLRNRKVQRAESVLSKLRAWRVSAVIARHGASVRSIEILETGLKLGDVTGLDMREVARERQELERLKLERDMVTAILNAMETGDMDCLERVVKMAEEMEFEAREAREAKEVLEVARARGAALLSLRDALGMGDVERIQRAIEEAELMSIEDEMVLYAKVMVVQLTAEAHAIALMEEGIGAEDVLPLEEGLGLAERLEMSDPRVEEARQVLHKIRPKWEAGLRLRDAMDARNDVLLEGALSEAEMLGVELHLLQEGNIALRQLRLEMAALARLRIAVRLRDIDEVAVAVEAAERLQVDGGEILDEGRALLEEMDKEGYVVSRLRQGMERKESPLLEFGLRMAEKYGMTGDLVQEARRSLGEMRDWRENLEDLREAMRDRDIVKLEASLASANEKANRNGAVGRGSGSGFGGSLSFNYRTEVVAEAERILEQLVAEERVRDAIYNEEMGELEFALAAAEKVELEGDLVERGRCILQLKRAVEARDVGTLGAAIDAASRLDLGKEYMIEGKSILDQLREELKDLLLSGGVDKEDERQRMQSETGELIVDEVSRSIDLKSIQSDLRLGAVAPAVATALNPKWKIEKFWKLRSRESFARTLVRGRHDAVRNMMTYTDDVLPISLLKLPKKLSDTAIICHKRLLQVCWDKPSKAPSGVTARALLATGNQTRELRDEIFVQVCRHLTGNTNRKSERRGWVVLCLCTDTFEPSEDLLLFLFNFCGQHWDDKRNLKMARYCFFKLGESLHLKEDLQQASGLRTVRRRAIMGADDITDFLSGSVTPWSDSGSSSSSRF